MFAAVEISPLTRSLVAEGWTILDIDVAYRWRFIQARVQVNNLLDSAWKEVRLTKESRLANEAEAVEDTQLTPGWPRGIQGALTFSQ